MKQQDLRSPTSKTGPAQLLTPFLPHAAQPAIRAFGMALLLRDKPETALLRSGGADC